MYQFKEYLNALSHAASVYLQSKGELWLIAGFDYDIYLYSIKDNKWKLLDIKLPAPLSECTCICSKDERFIIIFGGEDSYEVPVLTLNY